MLNFPTLCRDSRDCLKRRHYQCRLAFTLQHFAMNLLTFHCVDSIGHHFTFTVSVELELLPISIKNSRVKFKVESPYLHLFNNTLLEQKALYIHLTSKNFSFFVNNPFLPTFCYYHKIPSKCPLHSKHPLPRFPV